MLAPGTAVVAYLKEPREQIWGVLLRLEPAGLLIKGIDLGSFEDFLKQFPDTESRTIDLSTIYYPTARLEKLLLDETGPAIPALQERFSRRAGIDIRVYVGLPDGKPEEA